MARAITVDQIMRTKFREMAFEAEWLESFGVPEMSGVWIIWGNSGNGKTRFALQLAKYLCTFDKVVYDSLEEGARKSFREAIRAVNMKPVSRRFLILHREPMEDLKERLRKHKSARIVIIDSIQYSGITKKEYTALKEEFADKLFIFISHAEGRHPEGRLAKFVRYDADVKIHIEGYRAMPVSRYGGGRAFTIWQDGADHYWGETPTAP